MGTTQREKQKNRATFLQLFNHFGTAGQQQQWRKVPLPIQLPLKCATAAASRLLNVAT